VDNSQQTPEPILRAVEQSKKIFIGDLPKKSNIPPTTSKKTGNKNILLNNQKIIFQR